MSRIRQQLEQSQTIAVQGTRVVTRGGVSYEQRLHKKRSEVATIVLPKGSRPEPSGAENGNSAQAPVTSEQTASRLAGRVERVAPNARVRRLIQQAQSKLKDALDELSREQGGEDQTLKRLFLHLTHLRSELSSAEERLLETGSQPKKGAQGC